MIWIKVLLFTVFLPGTVTVGIPWLLLSLWPPPAAGLAWPLRFIGLTSIVLGAAGYLACAWDFAHRGHGTPAPWDPPRKLVATGLYTVVRNPMYVSLVLLVAGEALFFASIALGLYAALVLLVFHLRTVGYEERALRKTFGESYEQYCATVPRWIPRLRRGPALR